MTNTTHAADITTVEVGYCFAHHGRTTFVVVTHRDGQETTTCRDCGAVGYGPALSSPEDIPAEQIEEGDHYVTGSGGAVLISGVEQKGTDVRVTLSDGWAFWKPAGEIVRVVKTHQRPVSVAIPSPRRPVDVPATDKPRGWSVPALVVVAIVGALLGLWLSPGRAYADPVPAVPGGVRVVSLDAGPAGPAIAVTLSSGARDILRPCRFEDGRHCYWLASEMGNGIGRSLIVTRGRVHYVSSAWLASVA